MIPYLESRLSRKTYERILMLALHAAARGWMTRESIASLGYENDDTAAAPLPSSTDTGKSLALPDSSSLTRSSPDTPSWHLSAGQDCYDTEVKGLSRAFTAALQGCDHTECFAVVFHVADTLGGETVDELLGKALENAEKEQRAVTP
ncbi:uncharacterized protein PG986_004717 [Apiospora aurea]|uniref:Uncharacterized protein n=1 Tax=Apiospora aurea TaxID=335848 RepID=A0ABR1QND5_9PEZI